ncbi:hypothetical protein A7K69_16235 [Parageobacillus thermoglucosidasius]|uniref:Uncharacterized protein n=1 Tax=Parageobacillus thermoglucosidasius TaxID=1426 RepID=A0A1B7KVI4_PARTM|nr:hypothetical protein A7K69_16235 [Parageobacillus thermoglucosidasius]
MFHQYQRSGQALALALMEMAINGCYRNKYWPTGKKKRQKMCKSSKENLKTPRLYWTIRTVTGGAHARPMGWNG